MGVGHSASDPEVSSASCAEALTTALAATATMEQALDAKSLSLIIWSAGMLGAHVPMFLLAALLGKFAESGGPWGLYLYGCNSGAMQDQLCLLLPSLVVVLSRIGQCRPLASVMCRFCCHPW